MRRLHRFLNLLSPGMQVPRPLHHHQQALLGINLDLMIYVTAMDTMTRSGRQAELVDGLVLVLLVVGGLDHRGAGMIVVLTMAGIVLLVVAVTMIEIGREIGTGDGWRTTDSDRRRAGVASALLVGMPTHRNKSGLSLIPNYPTVVSKYTAVPFLSVV